MTPTEIETLKLAIDGLKTALQVAGGIIGFAASIIVALLWRGFDTVNKRLDDMGATTNRHGERLAVVETHLGIGVPARPRK